MARPRPQLEFKHDAGEPPQARRPDTMLTLPRTPIPALKSCYCQEFQIHLSLKHICNSFIHNQAVGLVAGFPVSSLLWPTRACFAVSIDFYGAHINSLTSLSTRLAPPEIHEADQSRVHSRTFSALPKSR